MTYLYLTTSYGKGRKLMQDLRNKMTKVLPPGDEYIYKSTANKMTVLQKVDEDNYVCIRTYIILIIPVIVNFNALKTINGDVCVSCEDLIMDLEKAIITLKNITGQHTGRCSDAEFKKLAGILHGLSN